MRPQADVAKWRNVTESIHKNKTKAGKIQEDINIFFTVMVTFQFYFSTMIVWVNGNYDAMN